MTLSGDRRRLLKLLGLGAAASMPAFRPGRMAAAAEPAIPKRFLAAIMFNGVQQQAFWPEVTETEMALTGPLPPSLQPLEAVKSKLLVIRGLKNAASIQPGGSHNRGYTAFTGLLYDKASENMPNGITVDQAIANTLGAPAGGFKSLQFSTLLLRFGQGKVWSSGAGQSLPTMQDPKAAFDRVFGDFSPSATPTTAPNPAELEAARLRQKSMFDHVTKDLTAVAARLDGPDRRRLEAHLTSLREIEKRLSAAPAPSMISAFCGKPNVTYVAPVKMCDSYTASFDPRNDPGCHASAEPISKLHMEIIAAAFACDRTRVAAMQWSVGTSQQTFPWLGITTGHHSLSHMNAPGISREQHLEQLHKIDRWHVEQLANLCTRLDAYKERDGRSVLDHAVGYFTSEIGKGDSHQITDMPVLLVGSAGGALKTGRYLKFVDRNQNDVLISLLNAFGNPVTTFGTPELCKGALPLT